MGGKVSLSPGRALDINEDAFIILKWTTGICHCKVYEKSQGLVSLKAAGIQVDREGLSTMTKSFLNGAIMSYFFYLFVISVGKGMVSMEIQRGCKHRRGSEAGSG